MESVTVQQMNTGSPASKSKECTEQHQNEPKEKVEDEDEIRKEDLEDEDLMEVLDEDVLRRLLLSGEKVTVKETFPSNGLISILKKRKDSSPVSLSPSRSSSKCKVRFTESDALLDIDEMGEDSCLFFLVLCLVTVVISVSGTLLYCFLGGSYSNICADFSLNMDFYRGIVSKAVDTLTHWFIHASP